MEQYINKSALVAEMERIKREECPIDTYEGRCKLFWFEQFLSFLNTLEVKEVDLEKEIKDYFDSQPIITRSKGVDYRLIPTSVDIAKHFYELGLKVQKGK